MDTVKCNICHGLHPWREIKDAQGVAGLWSDYCPIYAYDKYSFYGDNMYEHVNLYSDEIMQEHRIEQEWKELVADPEQEPEDREFKVICSCGHWFLSSSNRPYQRCINCCTTKEEWQL